VDFLGNLVAWFLDGANWTGSSGIPNRLWEHTQLSAVAMVFATAVALPPALWLGHYKRGGFVAIATVNIGRAIPSFAIMALFLPISIRLGLGLGFWPALLALFVLALPPIFTNAYTAVREVDPALVEAARGMGLRESQHLLSIEIPIASPLIMTAIRVSAVQVVATATLAALLGWGTLGRYIIDGFAVQDNVRVAAGGLLVAAYAIATEQIFNIIERRVVPRSLAETDRALTVPPPPA